MSDLVIKISGDIKSFKESLEEAQSKTEDLGSGLKTMAATSAVALAGLTAAAYSTLKAYGEQEAATNKLTSALQQQGIYSKALMDDYQAQADALQAKTGIDGDAIRSAQALMQGFIGQTRISNELTRAVVDLSAAQGMDLQSAFQLASKAINGNDAALQKYGIQVELTHNKAENMKRVADALTGAFGGQAEAANQGIGSIKGLAVVFGDLQEGIGKRLAPVVTTVVKGLTNLISTIANNDALLDFITSIGVAGGVVATLGTIIAVGGLAFLKLKAAMLAAGVATQATTVAVRGLMGATGIGLLVIVLTEVWLNWSSIWPRMQGVFQAFVGNVTTLLAGLGKAFLGIFSGNFDLVTEGIKQAKEALVKGLQDYNTTVDTKLKEQQAIEDKAEAEKEAKNNAAAAAREARERAHAARLAEIEREKRQLKTMEAEGASKEMLDLQRQEIALLEAIDTEKNAKLREALTQKLEIIRQKQEEQRQLELAQRDILNQEILAKNEEYEAMSDEQKAAFMEKNGQALQAQILTEKTAREQALNERLGLQIKEHNEFLKNQQKFGTAYAMINKLMHSEVYQGSKTAFGELAQLQSSSNSTLKGIGKAAALANIAMKTAESAMNIYAGFSTIPIVGPALGIAGAAAAVAFGAEQAGQVMAAADGGLLTGGIPGRDSIPVLGMPGELVVPTRNFDEVVNAVAASRSASASPAAPAANGGVAHLILELRDDLMDFFEAKQVERQNLGISIVRG